MAMPFSPDWRWLRGREDTQWNPKMRLFRQPAGDWVPVFHRLEQALREEGGWRRLLREGFSRTKERVFCTGVCYTFSLAPLWRKQRVRAVTASGSCILGAGDTWAAGQLFLPLIAPLATAETRTLVPIAARAV
jgi:hypothetical protein